LNGNLESQQAIMVLSKAKAAEAAPPPPAAEKSTSQ